MISQVRLATNTKLALTVGGVRAEAHTRGCRAETFSYQATNEARELPCTLQLEVGARLDEEHTR